MFIAKSAERYINDCPIDLLELKSADELMYVLNKIVKDYYDQTASTIDVLASLEVVNEKFKNDKLRPRLRQEEYDNDLKRDKVSSSQF
jgi:hypothetical protein